MMYFMGPDLQKFLPAGSGDGGWAAMAAAVWRYIIRPVAVGGMMVGAATLIRMGKKLTSKPGARPGGKYGTALLHGIPDPHGALYGLEDGSIADRLGLLADDRAVFLHLGSDHGCRGGRGRHADRGILALATVSGNLVGVIGSSNNPISGLTLSTLIIAALLMVSLGVSGPSGVAVVLGVAAVVCVSSAVAGELMQDFKAGYILGGTPRNIQIVELIAVVLSSLVMYFPLYVLHIGNIKRRHRGFGDPKTGRAASRV